MKLLYLCLIAAVVAGCPPGEFMHQCRSPCQPTCQNRIHSQCFFTTCLPGCVCEQGLIRDESSGQCVEPQLCPLNCQKNEIENILSLCEPTCPRKKRNKPFLVEIKDCICKLGLVRDITTNKCVPLHECPNVCRENQVLSNCTNNACRRTCQNKNTDLVCSSDCQIGCVCKDGYIWDEYQKHCVPEDECPEECGENEEYKECSDKYCKTTCDNIGKGIYCPFACLPGCSCKPDYVYDEDQKKCIHKMHCSKGCKKNEEWSNCINGCQETCHFPGRRFCTLECKSGCTCQKGFLWDKFKDKCVKKHHCSKICGANQVWSEYVPEDIPTCQSLKQPLVKGWYSPSFITLKPGCICTSNLILDENTGECIDLDDCLSGRYSTSTTKHNFGTKTKPTTSTTVDPVENSD